MSLREDLAAAFSPKAWLPFMDPLLALPPGAEEAYELGRAWQRVKAAAEAKGWRITSLVLVDTDTEQPEWEAEAARAGLWPQPTHTGYAPTPAAALHALADNLEGREQ